MVSSCDGEVLYRARRQKNRGVAGCTLSRPLAVSSSTRPSIDSSRRVSYFAPAEKPAQRMAARPRGTVPTMVPTLLLLSLTLCSHLASTELNTNPPEPSDVVDGPLPDEYEVPEVSSIDGGDTASTTESDTNDEPNEIHAADGLDVHGEVLSLRLQNDAGLAPQHMVVPNSLRPAPVSQYDGPYTPVQYNPLHSEYRQPRRPFSFVRSFRCTFEGHACGMRNQKNIGAHFKLVSDSIAGRRGRYMAVDSHLVPAGVSRLITPYLPGFPNSMVCLQMMYIVNGPGAERIQVVAQDMGNRPLFSLERHPDFVWKNFAINMTVHQDVRFFIEAYTNGRPGLIAIDDFTYSFDPCR